MKTFNNIILPFFILLCKTTAQDIYTGVKVNSPNNELSPEVLTLTFNLKGQDVQLHLEQNQDLPTDIPVILGRDGRMSSWKDNNTNFATYIDKRNNASFILEHKKNSGSDSFDTTMKGSFRHKNTDYIIEPAPRPTRKRRSTVGQNIFKISLAPLEGVNFQKDTEYRDSGINTTQYVKEWADFMKENMTSASMEPVKQFYEVETMFFIDYAIYDRFYKNSKETSDSNKVNDAISNIRFYYAHIFNGMSLRYKSIDYFDYALDLRLVGMFIALTPLDSDWTFKSGTRDPGYPRDFTHAYNALDDFEAWINLPHPDLPLFDQASLFTGNQLFRGYNNDRSHSLITGLADIASVCGKLRASISQDNGIYATIQTAAHEMGHNIGAYHDGQNNECTFLDQFVMASSPTELTDANYKNAFTFSYCSKNAFRSYILLLNLNNKNCMLERGTTSFSQGELDTHLLVLPGEKYTLDQQCQQVFGKESYYCGGHSRDLAVCRKMYCYEPNTRTCFGRTEQRAASGTPCGNMKWCQDGNCVFNAKAPAGEEFCRTGDFKGTFVDGRTCLEITRDTPWECYTENIAGDCCVSCGKVMDSGNPDCKYGDKSSYCSKIVPHDCYSESTRNLCCKRCANINSGIQGCEYGDKASWCPSSTPSSCYTYQDATCCKTCADRVNKNKPNCPFGDKVSWCDRQDRSRCYESTIKDQCCDTCERHETGIAGCEYGDRSRYCTQSDCNSITARQDCCYTCRATFSQTTTAPPLVSDSPFCKFGDMASWCPTYVKSANDCKSDTVKKTCCMSCMIIPNQSSTTYKPVDDCPKDKASWCPTIPTSYCYDAPTEKTCCATCRARKSGSAGCEYGDMRTWCRQEYCATNKSLCCKTCA